MVAYRKRHRRPRHKLAVLFSSKTVEWSTPQDFFDELNAEFGFDLDPCATVENAKCARYFTMADNGLAQPWPGRVFMNPPYGRAVAAWMEKASLSAQTTAELVVCLVPARTDTRWWHDYAMHGEVRLLRGRLKFGGASAAAPFPSALIIFRNGSGVSIATSDRYETDLEPAA
jgi:phage N-6-adenine-methyltransferase